MYAGNLNQPETLEAWGWMVCDGRKLEIELYPQLFEALGKTYNDWRTDYREFNIPDYRGMFMRGVDMGSGNDPDARERKLPNESWSEGVGGRQADQIKEHNHRFKSSQQTGEASYGGGMPIFSPTGINADTENTGGAETRPVNVSVYFIIRFV